MEDKDLDIHEIYPIEEAQDIPSEASTDTSSGEFPISRYGRLASPSVKRTRNLGRTAALKETSPSTERKLRKTYSLDSKPQYSPANLRNIPQRNPSLDRIIDYGRATMRNSAYAPTGIATGITGQLFSPRKAESSGSESDSELSYDTSSSSSSYNSNRIIGLSIPFQNERLTDFATGSSSDSSKSVSSSGPDEEIFKSEPAPQSAPKKSNNQYSNKQTINNSTNKMYHQQQYYPAAVQEEEVVYEVPQQKKKLFRNPFKGNRQQVVEESYDSYPEEQHYEEQPSYQEQSHWGKGRFHRQQHQQQYQPEQYSDYSDQSQSDYSDVSDQESSSPSAGMSLKKKLWHASKPWIIKTGTTLVLSYMLPPKYVPMARNMLFKVLGVPIAPSAGAHRQGGRLGGLFGHHDEFSEQQQQQQYGQPQQAYVKKRKVGKAIFRKVLLVGGGLAATGLSALLAWRFLLKPKFGKNIYSNEPKSFGKLEKNEDIDEQLAYQQGGSRMVERRIKKSPFGIKGSPAVLEKRTRTTRRYEEPAEVEGVYVEDSSRPALFGQLKDEMQSRNI